MIVWDPPLLLNVFTHLITHPFSSSCMCPSNIHEHRIHRLSDGDIHDNISSLEYFFVEVLLWGKGPHDVLSRTLKTASRLQMVTLFKICHFQVLYSMIGGARGVMYSSACIIISFTSIHCVVLELVAKNHTDEQPTPPLLLLDRQYHKPFQNHWVALPN